MRALRNVSFKQKILLPVILLVAVMVLLSVVNSRSLARIVGISTEISEDYAPALNEVNEMRSSFQELQKIAYKYIIVDSADKAESVEAYLAVVKQEFEVTLTELETEYITSAEEEACLASFKEKYNEFQAVYDEVIELSKAGRTDEAIELANGDLSTIAQEEDQILEELSGLEIENTSAGIAESNKAYVSAQAMGAVMLIVGIILAVLVIIICNLEIVRPIVKTSKELSEIVEEIVSGEGDLTRRINIAGKDEAGMLSSGINTFIETLQHIMGNITENTISLDSIVNQVSSSVSNANGSACDISAAMEELSASMEEVSATAANVNENTSAVGKNVYMLADSSVNLHTYADEMEKRASELENTAVENKDNTSRIIENILASLEKAMEDSKSVDKVNELTNDILSISAQTNLLALNASIEAARAGEAGKGFAVVADEIRQLADSSRETASNIQNINNMVTSAVHALVKNSGDIVSYINETILPDYDGFVKSGKQYKEDAVHVNIIVKEFNNMADDLRNIVSEITESIQGIASAVEESANAVSTAAMNTNDLVEEITHISYEMENNNKVAAQLKGEADRFVNL